MKLVDKPTPRQAMALLGDPSQWIVNKYGVSAVTQGSFAPEVTTIIPLPKNADDVDVQNLAALVTAYRSLWEQQTAYVA